MRQHGKLYGIGFTVLVFAATLVGQAIPVSAADCSDNSVIRCGVTSQADLVTKYRANQQGNVQLIYREMGIPNEQSMTGLVAGTVRSDNKVYVGDKVVATNALSTGRQEIRNNNTPIAGGAAYKRPPSESFARGQSSLPAYVKMVDNRFQYAIITECGNPVSGTPVAPPTPPPVTPVSIPPPPVIKPEAPAKPAIEIDKTVKVSSQANNGTTNTTTSTTSTSTADNDGRIGYGEQLGRKNGLLSTNSSTSTNSSSTTAVPTPTTATTTGQTGYSDRVNAGLGDEISYRIVVRNTGEAKFEFVNVKDKLPLNVKVVDWTLDGKRFTDERLFASGVSIGELAVGQSKEIIINAQLADTRDICNSTLTNQADTTATGADDSDTAIVTIVCEAPPKPVEPTVTPPPPAPTPPLVTKPVSAPEQLPITGGASIVATMVIVTLLGAAMYRIKEAYAGMLKG